MASSNDDFWNWDDDDEEVVPLEHIRPSKEHFGPVPGAVPKGAQPGRPDDARRGRPQRSDSRGQGGGSPQGQSRRRDPDAYQPYDDGPGEDEDAFLRRLADGHNPAPIGASPTNGWRGAIHKFTGGAINLGLSNVDKQELEHRRQCRLPIVDGTAAVFSRKGGVGKTTITAYLGLTLAAERGGRIVVLDGDAEAGSLGWLLSPRAPSTLASLASADPVPSDYAELRKYTTSTPEGLEVIVGDPAEMGPISTTGLSSVVDQLSRHYDISIFDTGAGVTRATGRVLVNSARILLLAMGPSVDSVRAAERTLAWLDERSDDDVRRNIQVIAVVNSIPPTAKKSHIDRIEDHFGHRCSAVVRIPWDAHLAAGNTVVSLDRLSKQTRAAFLELAGATASLLARSSDLARAGSSRR